MKTLLFGTAWAENQEHMDGRCGRWYAHHQAIPWPCEVVFALIGDGVSRDIRWPAGPVNINLIPHLGRPGHLEHEGWWRSFSHAAHVAKQQHCDRIWHVETDAYVASRRAVDWLYSVKSGWEVAWCPRYGFPETCIQAIGGDQFERLADYGRIYNKVKGQHPEHILPFSRVERGLIGDRYGETGDDPGRIDGLDYYVQCPPHITVPYRQ